MDDEKKIGENCTFIFKKRCLKSRGARKRQESSSEEGKVIFRIIFILTFLRSRKSNQ